MFGTLSLCYKKYYFHQFKASENVVVDLIIYFIENYFIKRIE
jgi:hypothetical protein